MTGVILKYDGSHWRDTAAQDLGSTTSASTCPDKDVFAIDAMANPPAPGPGQRPSSSGVGTILFNMAVNPVNGKVYVTNTEAEQHAASRARATFAGHSRARPPAREPHHRASARRQRARRGT